MADLSIAATLQGKLTEHGLTRTLGRQDVSPELVRELTIEEAARVVQRRILGPGPTPKAPKAARKKTVKYVAKAKKTKKPVARKSASSAVRVVRPNYWKRVKNELHVLICTNDARYAALRKHLGKESKTTQVALVSSIAATIGAYIGVAAAIVGPFVTLGLMALLQVGKNAWCAGEVA
ncbi:hypothetical protein KUL72_23745 [Bradyrhizobium arachidis]|uniref:hypothetical protein n=1 Tax=Bradyrhizobium arachidis TaxID=858423 RepID=UPI002161CA5A|nr:hypothetical protein [Bradyrhizobium arachidis]UVO34494.1 hypothetical protein KUL72_23745 [Bradyrhizobium arachidis]